MYSLLNLEIENYRSFYTKQVLSFGDDSSRVITALFGPNAGGKSNTGRALAIMQACILNSADANWRLPYEPFLLRQGSNSKPCSFGIRFAFNNRIFDYSFSFNSSRIVEERLREKSDNSAKMKTIFHRNLDDLLNTGASRFGFGKRILNKTRSDTLLITKGREDNNEFSNIVFGLFESITLVLSGTGDPKPMFVQMLRDNEGLRTKTIALLKKCDFAIQDILLRNVPIPNEVLDALPVPDEIKSEWITHGGTEFRTIHVVRDAEETVIDKCGFDFWSQESMGTQKFFEVAVPIIDALDNGKTIYIDEFGTYIHPTLVTAILDLFRKESNTHGAKLILNTHSTSMQSELNRDEILLVEKTLTEESRITPLADLGVRDGEAFEKRYRAGLYGAIPYIKQQ